jgi:hypothetical protein
MNATMENETVPQTLRRRGDYELLVEQVSGRPLYIVTRRTCGDRSMLVWSGITEAAALEQFEAFTHAIT